MKEQLITPATIPCPNCNKTTLVKERRTLPLIRLADGKTILPLLPLICSNCQFTGSVRDIIRYRQKAFEKVKEDSEYLAWLNPDSDAHHIWFESLVESLLEMGFSREKAEEIIDWYRQRAKQRIA